MRAHRSIALGGLLMGLASCTSARGLGPCLGAEDDPSAECGVLTVWENRDAGAGRRIGIRYMVLRASRQPAEEAPVFLLAGGPGQGGTGLAGLARGALSPVRETRDIVLVDQRGTGGSAPQLCRSDAAGNPAVAFGHLFAPGHFRRCREELAPQADLARYTTDDAVADLDEVREHLGYRRAILWGGSYGTRLAQAYARRHPERVLAMVLDGVVPLDFRAPATYARTLQQSVDRLLRECRERAGCRDSFPALDADFDSVVARLGRQPMPARVRPDSGPPVAVTLTLGDFGYAVRGMLYSAERRLDLPAMIHDAAARGELSGFAQRYWQRELDLGNFAFGLHLSVFCTEDVPFIRDAEVAALIAGSFIGSYLIDEYRLGCSEWGRGRGTPNAHQPLTAAIPTLLLSGWFDPVTPPETAERVMRTLSNSRHIVDRTAGHGATRRCALPAVLHVLIRARLDGLPSVCSES